MSKDLDWNIYHDMDNRNYKDVERINELEKQLSEVEQLHKQQEALCEKFRKLEEENRQLEGDLNFLRYCAHAHALYWYEQKYKRKRGDIKSVKPAGGFGYVMCEVHFEDGKFDYLTEETEAGMIIDWAKSKDILGER